MSQTSGIFINTVPSIKILTLIYSIIQQDIIIYVCRYRNSFGHNDLRPSVQTQPCSERPTIFIQQGISAQSTGQLCPSNVWCCSDRCLSHIYSVHWTSTVIPSCCHQGINVPGKPSSQTAYPICCEVALLNCHQKPFSNSSLHIIPVFH